MRSPVLFSLFLMIACTDKSTDTATASDDGAGEEGRSGADAGGSGDSGSEDGGSSDSGGGEDDGSGSSGSGDSGSGEDGGSGGSGSSGSGKGGGEDDGGGEDSGEDGSETLEITGNYISDMGEEHVITESYWSMDFGAGEVYEYGITQYDNASAWLVAENRSGEEAGYWSRFDWFIDSAGTLYVCQTEAFAASESDAVTTSPADASDLSTGCPYYGWLIMTPI